MSSSPTQDARNAATAQAIEATYKVAHSRLGATPWSEFAEAALVAADVFASPREEALQAALRELVDAAEPVLSEAQPRSPDDPPWSRW